MMWQALFHSWMLSRQETDKTNCIHFSSLYEHWISVAAAQGCSNHSLREVFLLTILAFSKENNTEKSFPLKAGTDSWFISKNRRSTLLFSNKNLGLKGCLAGAVVQPPWTHLLITQHGHGDRASPGKPVCCGVKAVN